MFGFGRHTLPDGFFRGACDVHCHLLPAVDDGFKSVGASLHALQVLEAHGVEKMILTPHFMKDYPDNDRASISEKFEAFRDTAAQVSKIELRLAAEYMLDACFLAHHRQGLLALDQGAHVLCETSYMMHEPGVPEMIYEVMCDGIQPVLAHPERYEYADRGHYARWKDKRYKFQLNLLSLAGVYGKVAEAKAHELLNQDYYDYVGSDMHGLGNFERFLPGLRLKAKEIDKLARLLENNKALFR